jgi:hypothetical protein
VGEEVGQLAIKIDSVSIVDEDLSRGGIEMGLKFLY